MLRLNLKNVFKRYGVGRIRGKRSSPSDFTVPQLIADIRCESCNGLLVRPGMLYGPGIRPNAAFVCIRCSRRYYYVGDPPHLHTLRPRPVTPDDIYPEKS
jgi:hypothetical protein